MAEEQLTNQEQPESRRGPGRPRKAVDVAAEEVIPGMEFVKTMNAATAKANAAADSKIVTIRASIVGVGFKTAQCPRCDVEKNLERISKVGFPVDNGHGTVTYYLSSRIEKLDVVG